MLVIVARSSTDSDSTASPQYSTSFPIARPLFTYGWRRISSMKSFAVTLSGFRPRTTTLTVSGTVSRTSFAIFNSWITKDVRLTVPETVKVVVRGRKPDNVTAKDFMLEILRHPYVKSGAAIGKLVEYCGDAVEALSVDERATMTNMTAEVGGFTGYVAPDEKTVAYLMAYRGMSRR